MHTGIFDRRMSTAMTSLLSVAETTMILNIMTEGSHPVLDRKNLLGSAQEFFPENMR